VIANQTPFYGESGGQIGDIGTITGERGAFTVTDTRKELGALHVHLGTVESGTIRVGDTVQLRIDSERRSALRRAHSATHLLHRALRRRLGEHVVQKGSLVAPDRLRFDFSHPKAVTPEELDIIESDVNTLVRQNTAVGVHHMSRDEAIAAGAMALFGEKYGDEVRVVSMGEEEGRVASIELCGGTHVVRTGDIGLCKVTMEGAVAAGVRRVEALTGALAIDHIRREEDLLEEAAAVLKATPAELPARVQALLDERRRLERELAQARQRLATGCAGAGGEAAGAETRRVNGIAFAGRKLEGVPAKDLRGIADALKRQVGSGVVAVASATDDGKAALVVGVTDDLKGRLNAVDLVRAGVAELGGQGGGGRPDLAQGGGPDGGRLDAALAAVERGLAAEVAAAG
jgi:alanyl-tRNA synthetase